MESYNASILELIKRDTTVTRVASTDGGEYAGPCPFCGGTDRFRVWPTPSTGKPRFWCRQCQKKGDAIQYVRLQNHLSFREALECLNVSDAARALQQSPVPDTAVPPCPEWQQAARTFVDTAQEALWSPAGAKALAWLRSRLFIDEIIRGARFGFNPEDRYQPRAEWGLPAAYNQQGKEKRAWLPRGIVIPWEIGGALWRVNIRRPRVDFQARGEKYMGPAGCAPGLYRADGLLPGRAAVLVEGEFDAQIVSQHADDLAAAVGAGSTAGARRLRWIAKLSLASRVLVSFDADTAGDDAARYWCDLLPNAVRWRPYWGKDVNEMAMQGGDLRSWVKAGLEAAPGTPH